MSFCLNIILLILMSLIVMKMVDNKVLCIYIYIQITEGLGDPNYEPGV